MLIDALSVKQPWANKIAAGEKTIETRTWYTEYRGDLLICSSKRPNIEPAGYALAIVELYDCRPMVAADETAACCEIYPGAWSWLIRNVRRLDNPFPVKGRLGIFKLEIPPICFKCGATDMVWINCHYCGGSGYSSHDCGEDCCC